MDIVPLSTQTLLDLARQDPCLKRVFGGVYASNELPKPRGQKANQGSIGLDYGGRIKCVKSWIVMGYRSARMKRETCRHGLLKKR